MINFRPSMAVKLTHSAGRGSGLGGCGSLGGLNEIVLDLAAVRALLVMTVAAL